MQFYLNFLNKKIRNIDYGLLIKQTCQVIDTTPTIAEQKEVQNVEHSSSAQTVMSLTILYLQPPPASRAV